MPNAATKVNQMPLTKHQSGLQRIFPERKPYWEQMPNCSYIERCIVSEKGDDLSALIKEMFKDNKPASKEGEMIIEEKVIEGSFIDRFFKEMPMKRIMTK